MWWLFLAILGFVGGYQLGGATVTLLGYVFLLPGVIFSSIFSAISGKKDSEGIGIIFSILFWAALAALLCFRHQRG